MAPSLGLGCWRLKTASCGRRTRFSSIRLRRVRNPRSTAPSQSRNRSNMATKVIADRLCQLPCEVIDFTAGQDCDEGQYVQVTSPKRTSGPRRYAVVSTPTCDLNRTGCSSGITCEMAILQQLFWSPSFSYLQGITSE